MSNPSFTQLTEPSEYAKLSLPENFKPDIAYLLGQCCAKTYQQYAQYPTKLAGSGSFDGGWSYQTIGDPITTVESITAGALVGQSGDYRTVPAGFAMHCTSSSYPQGINVIALRGTRTYDEWVKDIEAYPTQFLVGTNNGDGYEEGLVYGYSTVIGAVHGGFLNVYTQGENGELPTKEFLKKKKEWGVERTYDTFPRVPGSISKVVHDIVTAENFNTGLPLFITGHSLGAALAILCATDIAVNFPSKFTELNMYNLAGPSVAAGITVNQHPIYGPASTFVNFYDEKIPNSYRIVNAADIVPIANPSELNVGLVEIQFAHVVPDKQISFCVQTGSIAGNHSCDNTYLPYLKYLAENASS